MLKSDYGKTILVIPDSHANPDYPNDRFSWLGKLIMDLRPDIIVNLGDMADMHSLSSYDRGKKSFENRRFYLDVDAVVDAQTRMFNPLREYNEQRRKNGKAMYQPTKVFTLGNHEDRIDRLTNLHPELDGLISTHLLRYADFGWQVVPYKRHIEIEGVWFSHHFPTGVSGEPISGLNIGTKLLQKNNVSSIVGHSHVLDIGMSTSPDGRRNWGLSGGCYLDYVPPYAEGVTHFWWSGVVILKNVVNGDFNLETISIEEIRRRYG